MTQDEIIRMARDAGWAREDIDDEINTFERFADLVAAHEREKEIKRVAEGHGWTQAHWTAYEESIVAAEREACAKVCEERGFDPYIEQQCAAAIRARGDK